MLNNSLREGLGLVGPNEEPRQHLEGIAMNGGLSAVFSARFSGFSVLPSG
jgi:hypothetical protein